jgi:tetratricopeptide (TPR) repeat protein
MSIQRQVLQIGCAALMFACPLLSTSTGDEFSETTSKLARDLAAEKQHQAAAIEYRRIALAEDDVQKRAGYYWAAAYEYLLDKQYDMVNKMLDRVEDNSALLAAESLLLRAEGAISGGKLADAEFYLKGVIDRTNKDDSTARKLKSIASKRLAHVRLAGGNATEAKRALAESPIPCPDAIKSVDHYQSHRKRSPVVGGLMGLLPGLGYVYSGEYANAARSLILNGLFIFALVDTADDEHWGAFAALAFFELTWYSGSIYGGIDSAHRYNQHRLKECLDAIGKGSSFSAALDQIPAVSLKFEF